MATQFRASYSALNDGIEAIVPVPTINKKARAVRQQFLPYLPCRGCSRDHSRCRKKEDKRTCHVKGVYLDPNETKDLLSYKPERRS